MGSSVSSTKFGHLYLKPEKSFFYAGETVTGIIYLSLIQSYPGNTIVLNIKGKESTYWSEEKSTSRTGQDGKSETYHYTEYYHGNRQILNHRIPVYTFSDRWVPSGQYALPICFKLPDYIPGSFNYDKWGVKACIGYDIEAELVSIDKNVDNMIFSQPITLREPVKEQIHSLMGEMTINVKTWCCINKGHTDVKAYFEKNAYAPGETANVICEIDNSKCTLDMTNVQFVLINRKKLVSQSGHAKIMSEDISTLTQAGVKAQELATGGNRRVFSMLLERQEKSAGDIQPSTNGQLVSNTYFLRVGANPDGCICCSTTPHVEVPIHIYPPQQSLPLVQAPSGWNPVSMPVANLTITDAFLFTSQQPTGNVAPPADNQVAFGTNPSQNIQFKVNATPENTTFGTNPSAQQNVEFKVNASPKNTEFGANPSSNIEFKVNATPQNIEFGTNPSQPANDITFKVETNNSFGQNPSDSNTSFGQNPSNNNGMVQVSIGANPSGGFGANPSEQSGGFGSNPSGGFGANPSGGFGANPSEQSGGFGSNPSAGQGFGQNPGGNV